MKGQKRESDCAVALVLGAMVRADGTASPALRRRAVHALGLWRSGAVQALVLSGAERWHPPSEAEAMARILRAAGVPDSALILEERATSTEENIAFAQPLLADLGAKRVILVTDRLHGPRAALIARRAGLEVELSCPGLPRPSRKLAQQALREVVAYLWTWGHG